MVDSIRANSQKMNKKIINPENYFNFHIICPKETHVFLIIINKIQSSNKTFFQIFITVIYSASFIFWWLEKKHKENKSQK